MWICLLNLLINTHSTAMNKYMSYESLLDALTFIQERQETIVFGSNENVQQWPPRRTTCSTESSPDGAKNPSTAQFPNEAAECAGGPQVRNLYFLYINSYESTYMGSHWRSWPCTFGTWRRPTDVGSLVALLSKQCEAGRVGERSCVFLVCCLGLLWFVASRCCDSSNYYISLIFDAKGF